MFMKLNKIIKIMYISFDDKRYKDKRNTKLLNNPLDSDEKMILPYKISF